MKTHLIMVEVCEPCPKSDPNYLDIWRFGSIGSYSYGNTDVVYFLFDTSLLTSVYFYLHICVGYPFFCRLPREGEKFQLTNKVNN